MLSVRYSEYGSADVLRVEQCENPRLKNKNDVLIRVAASSVNAIDWKNRQGRFRLVSGLTKPRTQQGFDVAGEVVHAEPQTGFALGHRVFGLLSNFRGGAMSEYVAVTAAQITHAPSNMNWHQIAGLPMAATTAWQALHENAKLHEDIHVLVNGASSGVGHYAIQIAKAYGAKVTAVAGPKNLALCQSLGADAVINYEDQDFVRSGETYDIVFDVVNQRSLKSVAPVLAPNGAYIGTTPTAKLIISTLLSRRAHFVAVRPNKAALEDIRRLCETGLMTTHIDRVYPLTKIKDAHQYAEQSRTRGKLIIDVASDTMA